MNDDIERTEIPSRSFVPVCAIGASAGGVTALQGLFRHLPDDLGLAFVVILHLSPDQPSALSEILATCTRMPVVQIDDAPTLKRNCVFVIPPDRELVIEGDSVMARGFTEPRGHRAPIDMFFRSVAAARGDGIAVVLSGTGADGTLGLRAMKEAGGVIMVQEPAEAGFASMPQNAIATGDADVVAPLARLAERLAEAARSKEAVRSLDMNGSANDLRRIVAFLRSRTGHDFSSYKRATVMRRVLRRMQVCGVDTPAAYADYLFTTPEETKELFSDLLISVTMFFRDPGAFAALERLVIGPLFDDMDLDAENSIRVWVAGCATGEEAYSLSMLLLEEAARRRLHPQIQIFATDLDEGALATAREGRYPRTIEADVSDDRLARFFTNEGTHYRVRKELRDCVLFAKHSVIKEPPFLRLDLVTCRNLLIYLERSLQQQLCTLFHYGLKPGRFLFLGSAETADSAADLFAPLDREARIYGSRPHALQTLPILPQFATPERLTVPGQATLPRLERLDLPAALHVAALEESASPSALVDDGHAILHLSPTAGQFIQPSAGPLSNLLPAVVHPELRLDLRLALTRALEGKEPTLTLPVTIPIAGRTRRVAMHVVPVSNAAHMGAQALVLFMDGGAAPGVGELDATLDTRPDVVRRLHTELKASQEALVASRSGHEAAIQDLRASNEELQSINEEYRSTAEELETSKEEMQSINEELHTVNAELKSKLMSISVAHSDLQNLTTATEIGTLFLDADLRIKMFTPPVADLFSITTADIGRTIMHFTHRLEYDALEEDVHRVLRDLVPVEEEVRSRGGNWYVVRLRPYRTIEDRIDGTVVTFVDITARRQAEAALRASEMRFRDMADTAPVLIWEADESGLVFSNRHYLEFFGVGFDDVQGMGWARLLHPDDAEAYAAAYQSAFNERRPYAHEARFLRADGRYRWLRNSGGPAGESGFVGCSIDVTDLLTTQFALRESEELRRIALKGGRMGTWRWNLQERLIWGDAEFLALWGFPPSDEPLPLSMFTDRMTPEGAAEVEAISAKAIEAGKELDGPLEIVAGPTAGHWIRWRGCAASGTPSVLYGVTFDITQQRQSEEALRESEERLRQFGEASQDVLWTRNADTFQWDYLTPAFESIYGLDCEAALRGDTMANWLDLILPEDREQAHASLRQVREGKRVTFEYRIRRPVDGEVRWLRNTDFPIRDATGGVVRIGGIGHDVTELKEAEQALAAAELRQRALVEGIPQLVWRAIDVGEWTWASPQWTRYTGQAEVDSHGQGWLDVLHPDDREAVRGAWAKAVETGGLEVECRIWHAESESHRWFQTRATPVHDANGSVIEWLGTSNDIDDLRGYQERQAVLVAELQHRTRNLIGVVRSTADITLRTCGALDEFSVKFRDRLDGLARVQGLLSRLNEGDRITFDELIGTELGALGHANGSERVTLDGPTGVMLRSSTVQIFAMGLHELVTNAVKYGALKQSGGHLAVRWRLDQPDSDGQRWLDVHWQESGVAMPSPDALPRGGGAGRSLIERALPYQLGARVTYVMASDGVRCSISLPISNRTANGAHGDDRDLE